MTNVRCSDVVGEPLPGTSKPGKMYIVFEKPGAWSHDILDGGTFSPELSERLRALPGGLYLIRKHGREGHVKKDSHVVYLVFCEEEVTERLEVGDVEDLFDLDLAGPGRNPGAVVVTEPLLLVCTHSKRDVCCAIKGRPMAQALVEAYPDAPIWECSHTKGHRFAPSLVLMPHSYSFGRLNHQAAVDMYAASRRGEMFLAGARGRGIYDARGQVAELAVASALAEAGETVRMGALRVDGTTVTHADGRRFEVELAKKTTGGVLSSCGDEPKQAASWVAVGVRQQA
ncbi:sucrase ferredoxin [Corynebacterium vitaeruminis]|uniref:sucrase ferredoxin n=1 Tax=Corynebacterium vitaeruminis TaxID=38305 RepID=UPI0005586186|nr:sucrase ferredoxin [Corynebacterium vitaeruminis]